MAQKKYLYFRGGTINWQVAHIIVCPLHSSESILEGPRQLLFLMLHIFPFAYIFALPVFRESLKWRLESCHFDVRRASLTNVHLDSITDSSTHHPPPFPFPFTVFNHFKLQIFLPLQISFKLIFFVGESNK